MIRGVPILALIAGLILRTATQYHTTGDVLIWVGGILITLVLLVALVIIVVALIAVAGDDAFPKTPRRR
jgi:hypothetical protein